jgi:hypothetical protein
MNDLGTALRDVTKDLDVRDGFIGDVLRGGRRRQSRRRTAMAAGVAAVVGLLGVGVGMLVGAPPRVQSADSRLDRPTGGDLASDSRLAANAVALWEENLTFSWRYDRHVVGDPADEPHLFWAGTTPAGPAVVVLQRVRVRVEATGQERWRTAAGLVATDPADGQRKVVYSTNPSAPHGDDETDAFQFGPGDRTFLVAGSSTPVHRSTSASWDEQSRVTRTWERFDLQDGVGVWVLPSDADPAQVRLVATNTKPDTRQRESQVSVEPASRYLATGGKTDTPADVPDGLRWGTDLRVGEPITTPPRFSLVDALRSAGALDLGRQRPGSWSITAGLGNDRTVLVGENRDSSHPVGLYAVVVGQGDVVERIVRAEIYSSSALPVNIRLPGYDGWIVAAQGATLTYLMPPGFPPGLTTADAALVPSNATAVEVTRPGHAPEVVLLS